MYRVLLVDDEEMVTQGLSRFVPWADSGFEVVGTATSVARALTFLENNPVDLVITDIQMPIQNGLDLMRILNEQYPQIKTIILSGYADFTYAQQAIRLGALDYLTKPVNFAAMKQLLEKVRDILDCQQSYISELDTTIQQLLADTLIMNYVNGFPYDADRACTCLDTSSSIAVVRTITKDKTEMPEELTKAFCKQFLPCHVVSPNVHEFLAVLELNEGMQLPDEKIIGFLGQYSNSMQLCTGVSEIQSGYGQLRLAARQAAKAMHYQNARSVSGVTFYQHIKGIFLSAGERDPKEDRNIRDLVETLCIAEKRPQLLSQFTCALYALGHDQKDALVQAKRFCTELLIEMDASMQNIDLPNFPRHALLSETLIDVLASGDLTEINNCMTSYLQQLLQQLNQADALRIDVQLIDRVKEYIGKHFPENLTLSVLAESFYVSPVYLSRLFKKKTGTNFVEYLTALRIEKAKQFLANPNLKVYHVAEMVGYENPRYFARLFKESTGMVPQEYRNSLNID